MKTILQCIAFAAGLAAGSHAMAQADYPSKPLRFVVAFPAGNATDVGLAHPGPTVPGNPESTAADRV